jgi:crotonobetainyl-CoA:carnitine CoA-transferase CaiB-like acyl-CoA transferase
VGVGDDHPQGACGRKGEPPTLPPVQIGDLFGGAMMALSGILMALLDRGKTGKGRWIDVSMTDGALSMLSLHAAATLAGEIDPARGDMMLTGMFPCYETYRCADGEYVSVGPLEAWFWKGFVEALGRPDLMDGQYATGGEGERVRGELSKVFASRTRDEWVRHFEGKDVCLSPVLSVAEALAHPNTVGRGMVLSVPSPLGGTDRQPGMPIKIGGVSEAPRRAPLLGEHDDEVLAGLGYTKEQVAALRDSGVIRKP